MNPIRKAIVGLCLKFESWQMPGYFDILTLYEKGNFTEAYDALRKRIENHRRWSRDADAHLLLADLELRVNHDVCKAKRLLDKARELGSFDESYYYRTLSCLLWQTGQHKEAVQEMERSVAADPSVSNLLTLAGFLAEIDGKRVMALCQQALEKDPKNCVAHIHVGWEAFKSGDREKALLMASRAEELEMSASDVFYVGGLYHVLEEFQTALDKYLKAKMLGYDSVELTAAIAGCYVGLGQPGPAREYLERAIRLDPEDEGVKEVCAEYEETFGQLRRNRDS